MKHIARLNFEIHGMIILNVCIITACILRCMEVL